MIERDIGRMKEIIATCGYGAVIEPHANTRDNIVRRYVKIYTRGSSRTRRTRSLGRIEDVLMLSRNGLVQLVKGKFEKEVRQTNDHH